MSNGQIRFSLSLFLSRSTRKKEKKTFQLGRQQRNIRKPPKHETTGEETKGERKQNIMTYRCGLIEFVGSLLVP